MCPAASLAACRVRSARVSWPHVAAEQSSSGARDDCLSGQCGDARSEAPAVLLSAFCRRMQTLGLVAKTAATTEERASVPRESATASNGEHRRTPRNNSGSWYGAGRGRDDDSSDRLRRCSTSSLMERNGPPLHRHLLHVAQISDGPIGLGRGSGPSSRRWGDDADHRRVHRVRRSHGGSRRSTPSSMMETEGALTLRRYRS